MTAPVVAAPVSVVEVLTRARDEVAKPGAWMQGDLYVGDQREPSCCCAAGWIALAATGDANAWDVRSYEAMLHLRLALGTDEIPAWNDAPGRTQAEIVKGFDAAIQRATGAA